MSNRTRFYAGSAAAMLVTWAAPALASTKCEANISPSFEYFKLGDGTADGTQTLVSGAVACSIEEFNLSVRTAYVAVRVSNDDTTQNGNLNGLTDSVVSASYNFKPRKDQSLRFSLDVNAPTGLSDLSPHRQNALVDSDLVDFSRYGEGWNVGVGLNGATAIAPRWSLTAGGGYIYKGPYHPFQGDAELEPGGAWTGNLGAVYTAKGFLSKLTVSAYGQAGTQWGNVRFYRPGTVLSVEWYGQKQIGKTLSLFGSATYSHSWSGARYLQTATGGTTPAPIQAGETIAFSLGAQKQLSKATALGVRASYINRGAETIDPTLLDFIPKREIYSWSGFASTRISPRLDFSANIFAKLIYDQPSNLYTRQSYRVLAIDLRITRRFK